MRLVSPTPSRSALGSQRKQILTGRTDLDVGPHRRADPAVETRCPAAVVLLVAGQRVLPVVPEPLLVQAGVEVIPRQHFVGIALTGGEEGDVDSLTCERTLRGIDPTFVAEMLAPAVEAPAVTPNLLDHRADPSITAREQSFDQGRLAVVIAHPDVATQGLVRIDRGTQLAQPIVDDLGCGLRGPLKRSVRLRHEPTDRNGRLDVARPGGRA